MLVASLPGVRGPVGALTAPTGCLKPLNPFKKPEFPQSVSIHKNGLRKPIVLIFRHEEKQIQSTYRSIRSGKGKQASMSIYHAKLTCFTFGGVWLCPKLQRDHDDSKTLAMHKTQYPRPHPSSPPLSSNISVTELTTVSTAIATTRDESENGERRDGRRRGWLPICCIKTLRNFQGWRPGQ